MPLKRIKRWESEATRRRRAVLAKYRQGLNGKWESNAKKALARRAKQKSRHIGPMLASCKAAQVARAEQNLAKAQKFVEVLKEANQDVLRQMVPQLDSLPVTGSLLRRTLIPKYLRESACRCPGLKSKVAPIIQKWRRIYLEDKKQCSKQKEEAMKNVKKSRPALPKEPKKEPEVELVSEVKPQARPRTAAMKQRRITFFMQGS
ncbi:unnamed protein product [Symbiodinium natans]|uniref:TFIIS N-terminal domain-containing protein n=1 Tax=Symbiodinium natans TaxID=878477 RepID=A0A812K4E7_9DINO|nr:unnamed protein product [Symbiodinium natans]